VVERGCVRGWFGGSGWWGGLEGMGWWDGLEGMCDGMV
jgi:hypothetical protein